ncbi:hypothetical protein JTE90_019344 [Oedothorax gibbosus]|uniref:RING-type domain-containing protein n=1 Tax=Oedothorax gibbosus TaxID=931172 RepID=A0AAV6UMH5_9ARAC|nr:hypothetical protein JTE90_019344 [Oedothorax gibbosus]
MDICQKSLQMNTKENDPLSNQMNSVHQANGRIFCEMRSFDSNEDIDECVKSHIMESNTQDTFSNDIELANRSKIIHDDGEVGETPSFNCDSNEDMECGESRELRSPSEEMFLNEENCDIPDDSSSFDARRTRRKNKRKLVSDFCCPVCGITVREHELAAHYTQEVGKLTKIPGNLMKLRQRKKDGIKKPFVEVKNNRENRITAKLAKYAAKASQAIQCPICRLKISGCEEDIDKHVALCIQNEDEYDEHVVVDDDEDDTESLEGYEFVNTYRPEAMERPARTRACCDENEEVDVDVDDAKSYGEPQYPLLIYGDSDQLRKAVLGNPSAQPHVLELRKWGNIVDANRKESLSDSTTGQLTDDFKNNVEVDENKSSETAEEGDQTVTSLKEKIRELEDENRNVKCLICMEPYTKPVVSTTCWHVHCEECWLMTMGVKKLCPQCNMIVFPSDLRKIYL